MMLTATVPLTGRNSVSADFFYLFSQRIKIISAIKTKRIPDRFTRPFAAAGDVARKENGRLLRAFRPVTGLGAERLQKQ
jgi:hypothetical protein